MALLLNNTLLNALNKNVYLKIGTNFYLIHFVILVAAAVFFALGMVVICAWSGGFPISFNLSWGGASITCGR